METCIFELVSAPNLTLKNKFWVLEPNLPKKGFSGRKRKSYYYHWVLHIQISLDTKFQLKQKILIFWNKFASIGDSRSKTEKVNNAIEFGIFELV